MNQEGIDVAAPIIHWTTEEVWSFLAFSAKKVVPEVQYVIDLYGNTMMRFGCWMCTVVKKDKTLMALSAQGDITSKKLLGFREWLVSESRRDENRYHRRDGIKGRLHIRFRKKILKNLVQLQEEVRIPLISPSEISEIEDLFESAKYRSYS